MLIFWKVRYHHKGNRTFGDRTLCLDTQSLDPTTRATIEFLAESQTQTSEKRLVKFRPLFREDDWDEVVKRIEHGDVPRFVGLPDYLEDENGKEIADGELGPLLTGNPNAVLIPHGAKPHDIELMQAEPKPIPLDAMLSEDELRILGYFARDLKELSESEFRKEGPGRLGAVGTIPWSKSSNPKLETAVSDDEIRSFVTIFRRLYMAKEPANFLKAVEVYVKALGDHPYARWVTGNRNEYESNLASTASFAPFAKPGQFSFTTKRLSSSKFCSELPLDARC